MAEDFRSQHLEAFIDMMGQFLTACREVWPECNGLETLELGFNMVNSPMGNKKEFVKDYYDSLEPYFSRCNERDPTLFTEENIPFLAVVNMRDKWLDESVNDETRDCIWDYILQLNKLSQIYCGLFAKIPDATLERIQTLAMGIGERIRAGEMSEEEINPQKCFEIAHEVLTGLSEDEINAFKDNIDLDDLQEIAETLTGGMGGDPMALAMQLMGSGGGEGGNPMALAMQMMMGGGGLPGN